MCGVPCAKAKCRTSTGAACCSSMMHLGEFTSHSRTVWSYDPVTSSFGELGLRAPQRTKSVWPWSVCRQSPDPASHTFSVVSILPLTMRPPP